jgi:hypothetical protein
VSLRFANIVVTTLVVSANFIQPDFLFWDLLMKPTISMLFLVFLLAGCAAAQHAPTSTPAFQSTLDLTFTATPVFPLPEGAIIFETEPARKFAGHVYGQGETAVILANMSYGGETQWSPLVQALDKQKFSIITFNYRRPDYINATQDVSTVLKRLRQAGYKHVICIGASLGVTACGNITLEPEMVGMVMIAGPNYSQPVRTSYPKLFIAAADDPWSRDTEDAYKGATEPKQLVIYPGTGMHGTELFYSTEKEQFLQKLVDFVSKLP